jgi:hypothetical protein
MPEMKLLQLVAEPSRLTWQHSAGTLTVNYAKPPALLAQVGRREGGMGVPVPAMSVSATSGEELMDCASEPSTKAPAWHDCVLLCCCAAVVQELADAKAVAEMRAQEPPADCRQQ